MWEYSFNKRLLHLDKETIVYEDARDKNGAGIALPRKKQRKKPYIAFVQAASVRFVAYTRCDSIMCPVVILEGVTTVEAISRS